MTSFGPSELGDNTKETDNYHWWITSPMADAQIKKEQKTQLNILKTT